jgi:RNA methyltransferase, TrmH family
MITSSANSQIKQIRKLRDRKERHASGTFYAEGLRIVAEATLSGAKIETAVVSPELLTSDYGQQLVRDLVARRVPILEVSAEVFKGLALKENPQGLSAVIQQQWHALEDVQPTVGSFWVALDAVADPGNLGTILRTNDAVGGKGVILLDYSTDPYDPTAMRASMGAVFSQHLIRATFSDFAAWKRRTGIQVVGTSGEASLDYQEMSYPDPLVILMGSERQGLQEHHWQICDSLVRIPMVGRSDSLNLAVATAVTLYEVFNQRRAKDVSQSSASHPSKGIIKQ